MSAVRLLIAVAISLALALSGCTDTGADAPGEPSTGSAIAASGGPAPSAQAPGSDPAPLLPAATAQADKDSEPEPEPEPATSPAAGYLAWDASLYPDYYAITGTAAYDAGVQPGCESYGPLDSLGRATGVTACITGAQRAAARADDRDDGGTSDIDPSGWPSDNLISTIPGITERDYRGYLWNRSHLLADSLGGDYVAENLITGTRTQNVGQRDNQGGMAYCETRARDYLDSHPDGWLYYRVEPVYEADELIARGVWVDMRSDDGSIDERVYVFNAANGYEIDYTGASHTGWTSTSVEAPAPSETAPAAPADASTPAASEPADATYILNTNTGKFHLPGCLSVKQMSDKNKQPFSGTRDEAIAQGFSPCGRCNP